MNIVTIQGAHTIYFAIAVLGPLAYLAALNTRQYPEIELQEDHKRQARNTFDHVLFQARLVLQGGAPRGLRSGRLRLSINGEAQQVEEPGTSALPDEAANVAAGSAERHVGNKVATRRP